MAGHKILVIDDSGVIRRTVRDMLPAGNFEVLEAKDGLEGLNLIRQERPNLIMLDFILPKLSGWEVFQQVQGHPELQKIPLVIMSGRKEEVTQKIPEPFEYFEFIEKPFDKNILIDAIKEATRKSRLRPATTPAPTVEAEADTAATVGSGEIQDLKEQIAKMQAEIAKIPAMQSEIENLKKQLAQVLAFIKQKLK